MAKVFYRRQPATGTLPLVFDSPHSGAIYPADFQPAAPRRLLRATEDFAVDQLFAAAPAQGAVLLAAEFPRCYVDVNRGLDDLDPLLLDRPWPEALSDKGKSRLGAGLIWRLAGPAQPIYARQLSVAEVRRRLERYYQPYHRELAQVLDQLWDVVGAVWHINCHSMPSLGAPGAVGGKGGWADFVIGDRDGASAAPEFRARIVDTLREMGYRVAVNEIYKGDELVRRHGRPAARRHSLQIEINRRLYMDECRVERHAGFPRLEADLTRLIGGVARYVRAALGG
jgi:N-formylglutamate amidohydrolase